jgi:hypothetical protein
MNLRQYHQEARRRRLINRSVAQHRRVFFEAIRGSTVRYAAAANYATAPVRRSARLQPGPQDLDDPVMTRALQFGIVLTMVATIVLFRAPLVEALRALFL